MAYRSVELKKVKLTATLIVLVHLVVVLAHGKAHGQLEIVPDAWQRAFIAGVIVLCPLIAMALLWTRLWKTGFTLLALSMAGSLVFGLIYHFLLAGPDNALGLHHGHWQSVFGTTALLLALIESAGVVWPFWALGLETAQA